MLPVFAGDFCPHSERDEAQDRAGQQGVVLQLQDQIENEEELEGRLRSTRRTASMNLPCSGKLPQPARAA
jgi:hypothetical protein